MAKLEARSLVIETHYTAGWQEAEAKLLAEAQETAREHAAAKGRNGPLVGKLVRWQRADGYAVYIVTSQSPLRLQHVAIGDGWSVEPALIRGLIEDDVQQMVSREEALKALFQR